MYNHLAVDAQSAKAKIRNLLDQQYYTEAMIEMVFLQQHPASKDILPELASEHEKAREGFLADYPASRKRILDIMSQTDSSITFTACALLLFNCSDFKSLSAFKVLATKVDQSDFIHGTKALIDTLFLSALKDIRLPSKSSFAIKGTPTRTDLLSSWLVYKRDPNFQTVPCETCGTRASLGTQVWAMAYDSIKDRLVCTLPGANQVVALSSDTYSVEKTLESPGDKVRGLWLWPEERRGYFVSEFGNKVFRFNLDTLEIEKEITGCSLRPERLYAGPDKDVLVTGNLGLPKIYGQLADYLALLIEPSHEDKITTGKSITVIDLETDKVINTLAVGNRPTAVAISGNYIAAGNFIDNTVSVYDRSDLDNPFTVVIDPVKEVQASGHFPPPNNITVSATCRSRLVEGIAILDRRNWILVSGFDACLISIIDLEKREIIDVVLTQDRPFDVVVDAAEKYAYVVCNDANEVSIIDLDRREEIKRVKVGPKPQDLMLTETQLLVPDIEGLTVIDLADLNLPDA